MSGRGAVVTVQLINPTALSGGGMQEMALPVALHSPLMVFKEQLSACTGIMPSGQVLILCDLSDPDRNSDVHLDSSYDSMTLRDCRFQNNSVFTLHALGLSNERAQQLQAEAQAKKMEAELAAEQANKHSIMLRTPVTSARADHSFNGIIFDIRSKDAHEVEVLSISLGGMLGRIRIYARNCRWEKDIPSDYSDNYWGHHPGISEQGWELVAEQRCLPSWERHFEIWLDKPFKIQPHARHAFYCHSDLPDDLGILYQSCRKDSITVQDEHVQILPGLGHCGHRPFGNRSTDGGWYRSNRTIAGTVRYRSKLKGWNMEEHKVFPPPMRAAVATMLKAQKVSPRESPRTAAASPRSSCTPRHPLLSRAQSAPSKMESDQMDEDGQEKEEAEGEEEEDGEMDIEGAEPGMPLPLTDDSSEGTIGVLNERHLVRNIMEFCHYDWFKGADHAKGAAAGAGSDSDVEEDTDGPQRAESATRNIMQRIMRSYSAIAGGNGNAVIDVDDLMRMIAAQHEEDMTEEEEEEDDDDSEGEEDDDDDSSDGAAYQTGNAHSMATRSRSSFGFGGFGGQVEEISSDTSSDEEEGNEYMNTSQLSQTFFDAQEDDGAQISIARGDEEDTDTSSDEEAYHDAGEGPLDTSPRSTEEQKQTPSPGSRTRAALESIARRIPNSFTLHSDSPPTASAPDPFPAEDESSDEEDA